jgi:hypothetical protein
MSVISLLVTLIVIGVLLWVVNTYIPMQATMKKIVNIVVIVLVCLWILSVFGILPNLGTVKIGN